MPIPVSNLPSFLTTHLTNKYYSTSFVCHRVEGGSFLVLPWGFDALALLQGYNFKQDTDSTGFELQLALDKTYFGDSRVEWFEDDDWKPSQSANSTERKIDSPRAKMS